MGESVLKSEDVESIFDRKLGPLMEKLNEVLSSISFLSGKYDELNKTVTELQAKNKEYTTKIQLLGNQVRDLYHEVQLLKKSYDDLEQYGRRECLEIKGIPVMRDEDTDKIVVDLASKIGVNLKESDFSVSHRNPSKNDEKRHSYPAIIVKFTRRVLRDQLYKARSKLKDVTTKDLGFIRSKASKIYITESLTKHRRDLFNECLKYKKDENYRFLWTRYGRIFLRENEDSQAEEIITMAQLDR